MNKNSEKLESYRFSLPYESWEKKYNLKLYEKIKGVFNQLINSLIKVPDNVTGDKSLIYFQKAYEVLDRIFELHHGNDSYKSEKLQKVFTDIAISAGIDEEILISNAKLSNLSIITWPLKSLHIDTGNQFLERISNIEAEYFSARKAKLKYIETLKSEEIFIDGCKNLDLSSIANIKNLTCAEFDSLNPDQFKDFRAPSSLKYLCLRSCKTVHTFDFLENLGQLEELSCYATRLKISDISIFKNCQNLRYLFAFNLKPKELMELTKLIPCLQANNGDRYYYQGCEVDSSHIEEELRNARRLKRGWGW